MAVACLVIGDDPHRQIAPFCSRDYCVNPSIVVRSSTDTSPEPYDLVYRDCDGDLRDEFCERTFVGPDTERGWVDESLTAEVAQAQGRYAKREWVGKRPCEIWDDFDAFAAGFLGLVVNWAGRYGFWGKDPVFWGSYQDGRALPLKEKVTPDGPCGPHQARVEQVDWSAITDPPYFAIVDRHVKGLARNARFARERELRRVGPDGRSLVEQDVPGFSIMEKIITPTLEDIVRQTRPGSLVTMFHLHG